MKNIFKLLLFLILLLFSGCNPNSPLSVLFSPPKVDLVNTHDINATSSSFFQIVVTVKNDGSGASACNVGCTIKLKNGNYKVESETGFFGTLNAGESTSDAVWFTNVKTSTDFQNVDITVYWWDSQGNYYQN